MNLEELFLESKKITEDGEGAGGGAVAAADSGSSTSTSGVGDAIDPIETADNSSGIKDEDVLGKWDPTKGFMAKCDFHIPKNVLGKGKYLKHYEIPSKKKKGHKNPYVKGMTVIEKEHIEEGALQHSYSGSALESVEKLKANIAPDTIVIDKIYYVDDYGIAWRMNKKGYVHIYMPTKVSINGEFQHFSIKHVMLTDKNTLKEINSFGDFPDKKTTLAEIKKVADTN